MLGLLKVQSHMSIMMVNPNYRRNLMQKNNVEYDYSDYHQNHSQEKKHKQRRVELGIDDHGAYKEWVISVAQNLAGKYQIEDEVAKKDLKVLIEQLENLPVTTPSRIELNSDKAQISEDQPAWSSTKEKLKQISEKMTAVTEELDLAIVEQENNVLLERLISVDYNDDLTYALSGLRDLEEILRRSVELNLRGGRQIRVQWSYKAVTLCKEFWEKHKNENPKAYFFENKAAIPSNNFTQWCCETLEITTGATNTKCKTYLLN